MATETPAIDAIPEISDTRRVELIQKISSMAPDISSTTWAVLWLSDIEQLEDLSNMKAGLLSATLTGLVVPTRQIILQWASRARSVDSDKTSKRKRSDSIKDTCIIRDKYCLLTGKGEPVEIAHIYPYSMMGKPKTTQELFWRHLESFWHPERIARWKKTVMDPSGVKVLENIMCLSRDSHGLWGKARFALQPLELSVDRKALAVRFFWIPVSKYMKTMGLKTTPFLPPNLGHTGQRIRLFNCESEKPICSGDVITMKTSDPDEYPLPSFELLEMQWFLTRALGLSGAADVDPAEWDSDSDDEEEEEELVARP
ncbi:hypothetical protein BDV36DRAFT_292333 [Aspergillus pseudocaelatus]|uniref:HNH nuclease domain-containing protein n=1 Tax=Aspergillus pseudocaelatus TaxID=1825620 RepID=A0ABQ6WWD8_9EURO|nr:hypothetical protein BDV36DRAFT_292333 [Aspergillus pseudocaelatus]